MRRCLLLASIPLVLTGKPVSAQLKASGTSARSTSNLEELRRKHLLFPVADQSIEPVRDNFNDARDGNRVHHALDIPAPRGTPVLSTDSGRVLKLYRSKAGGIMMYATDTSERFIYQYAHLQRYHDGLTEGARLARGDTIGYVGTTGNAPPDQPHLHFAILRSYNVTRWSRGTPLNPWLVFSEP